MPLMETITIVNKSGKVVSTGKHLVNIFKDAKDAYLERKSEMRAEHREKIEYKQAQKLLEARNNNRYDDSRSVASSHKPRKHRERDGGGVSRPPLTERALSHMDDGGSVASSRRSSRSHHGHGSRRGSVTGERERYRRPYVEEAGISQPHLSRRHTDYPPPLDTQTSLRPPVPVPHPRQISRSTSNPDLRYGRDHIDMNLAYGELPPDLMYAAANSPTISEQERELELKANMSKLDQLLLEAHCVQHSATAIIKNLQENPEAMAAVALTLAEISNLLKKMSPAILTAFKSSSPAAFALLASPQFLIAGGLALGVTVVMFGGYKIVKRIQESNAIKKEANQVEEALVWDQHEMGGIESWRRGIEYGPVGGDDATSVEGEFITPEAARQRKERVREMRRDERREGQRSAYGGGSVAGESDRTIRRPRSGHTLRTVGSDSTIRRKAVPLRTKTDVSVSGRSVKGKEIVEVKEKKKSSALSIIFNKKTKEEKKDKKDKKKDGKKGKAAEV